MKEFGLLIIIEKKNKLEIRMDVLEHFVQKGLKRLNKRPLHRDTPEFPRSSERNMTLIGKSLIGTMIEDMLKYVPKERILFFTNEQFKNDFDEIMKRICLHIGADPTFKFTQVFSNTNYDKKKENQIHKLPQYEELKKVLNKEILKCQELTGLELNHWLR